MQTFDATVASLLLLIVAANAFQTKITQSTSQRNSLQLIQRPPIHSITDEDTNYFDDDDLAEGEEFFVSQEQIMFLRKEAAKRESNRKIPKFVLSSEESTEISQETMDKIIKLFDASEIIEVRGISRDVKKNVYDTANSLAVLLEEEMGRPVVIVIIKGFAAKLYCPWDDDRNNKIQLRTSYKPNQWSKKPKPLRDNRGQIIKGEDGKSIKVIPE
ncbi:hypothetical protein HJC23_010763 [Cyclotella cryptica]|uniref:CRM domain-containing protein n=1 Tax=Cyclotella cryptica TaxID=29204 RepID=A0ABD3PUW2_9STRA|eukprot:CCRYP_011096-RA/>CCRYP_011096-RA protein AED:0.03 eAED:0.02 QI:0/-1/0/1/-1/1/1/0/214